MGEESALRRAQRIGDAAAEDTGFDWEDAEGALDKVREEVLEIAEELERGDHEAALAELGDLLFAAAMVARKLGGDAESALEASARKFERRYVATLELLRERGVDPGAAPLAQMEAAWQDVKRLGRAEGDEASVSGPERVYLTQAREYDRLIVAEDADGHLERHLLESFDFQGKAVVDVGAGTGRLSRWVAPRADRVHLVDVAAPMLEVARETLDAMGLSEKVSIATADARALPLEDSSVDVAMAGWVYGHFRYWMPEGWELVVDEAIAEMMRVTRPGGDLIVIETMGTGVEEPEAGPLDVYYERLEASHGFARRVLRTDYLFASVEEAVEVMGVFFGEGMSEAIRLNDWTRVPECTAVFSRANA